MVVNSALLGDRAARPADLVLLVAVAHAAPRPGLPGPAPAHGDDRHQGAERALAGRARDARGDARAGLPAPLRRVARRRAARATRRARGARRTACGSRRARASPAYHQPSWPRRTRCKEGNLAFFYDMWGYRLYDVVAQLDADHVPARDLPAATWSGRSPTRTSATSPRRASATATPKRSWAARGRLYAEAVAPRADAGRPQRRLRAELHRLALRRAHRALREVGGLGPELAEDFTDDADDELARLAGRVRRGGRGPRRRPGLPSPTA